MNYDFFNPTKLITGQGCIRGNPKELSALGKKCMIVTGGSSAKRSGALDDTLAALKEESVDYILFDKVQQNPLLSAAKEAGDLARAAGVEFIIGIGGGSPLDSAKATAVFAANDLPALSIYERSWQNKPLPIVAVGTTAGTGSEVCATAVLTTPEGVKQSVNHPDLYPRVAFGDPVYTASLPLSFTISTGLDALSHAVEGYFSTGTNEMADLFAKEAVRILWGELPGLKAVAEAESISMASREALYYGSVLAGYTLARSGTGYCHGLSYFLSEEYGVPHGTACAVYLPDYLRRAARLNPEKATALFRHAGTGLEELCTLIEDLHSCPQIKLTAEKIEQVAQRGAESKNFSRTGPNGYTKEEAVALLTTLFG